MSKKFEEYKSELDEYAKHKTRNIRHTIDVDDYVQKLKQYNNEINIDEIFTDYGDLIEYEKWLEDNI